MLTSTLMPKGKRKNPASETTDPPFKKTKNIKIKVTCSQCKSYLRKRDAQKALFLAIKKGHAEVLPFLLRRGASTTMVDGVGNTALHLAAEENQAECVNELLKNGANIEAVNKQYYYSTPLMTAASKGAPQAMKALIAWGCLLEVKGIKYEDTALLQAIMENKLACVKILLQNFANINTFSADGSTPLHNAALNGHDAIIKLLLQLGANKNQRNFGGETALDVAYNKKQDKCVIALGGEISSPEYGKLPIDQISINKQFMKYFNMMKVATPFWSSAGSCNAWSILVQYYRALERNHGGLLGIRNKEEFFEIITLVLSWDGLEPSLKKPFTLTSGVSYKLRKKFLSLEKIFENLLTWLIWFQQDNALSEISSLNQTDRLQQWEITKDDKLQLKKAFSFLFTNVNLELFEKEFAEILKQSAIYRDCWLDIGYGSPEIDYDLSLIKIDDPLSPQEIIEKYESHAPILIKDNHHQIFICGKDFNKETIVTQLKNRELYKKLSFTRNLGRLKKSLRKSDEYVNIYQDIIEHQAHIDHSAHQVSIYITPEGEFEFYNSNFKVKLPTTVLAEQIVFWITRGKKSFTLLDFSLYQFTTALTPKLKEKEKEEEEDPDFQLSDTTETTSQDYEKSLFFSFAFAKNWRKKNESEDEMRVETDIEIPKEEVEELTTSLQKQETISTLQPTLIGKIPFLGKFLPCNERVIEMTLPPMDKPREVTLVAGYALRPRPIVKAFDKISETLLIAEQRKGKGAPFVKQTIKNIDQLKHFAAITPMGSTKQS